jgi:hypothetical protein
MDALLFYIDDIRFSERDVQLRLPFRFGAATLESCPEVFVRVRLCFTDGSSMQGCAAEMMVPKWFDKNPRLTNDENIQQLRNALLAARTAYRADKAPKTAWQHFAHNYKPLLSAGLQVGLNPLVASYGPALIDRAIFDALCLKLNESFAAGMKANAAGIDIRGCGLADDLLDFDLPRFLSQQTPRRHIAARHTVGLLDAIREADKPADAPNDGLPSSLESAIARYGHHHFKLKLCGNTQTDLNRLIAINSVTQAHAQLITLDGNEQYANAAAFAEFFNQLTSMPELAGLVAKTVFVEQPIHRDEALTQDVSVLAQKIPLLIDESDATLDAFIQAKALGYTGVSSKSCKGFYKSVINAARCANWNTQAGNSSKHYFLSGEDLTMQAGIGVQQDLALVSWLSLTHVERNGHHYVNGLMAASTAEQQNALLTHSTLYVRCDAAVRLRIEGGEISTASVQCAGFGTGQSGAHVCWDEMQSFY